MSTPSPQADGSLDVRVFDDVEACTEATLAEFLAVVRRPGKPLVSFATGTTFYPFLRRLHLEISNGSVPLDGFLATHLDEYEGYTPDRHGSLVGELVRHCPALAEMMRNDTFLAVPSAGGPAELAEHRKRIAGVGGVALQLLGIGRNGHLAHCEPGTAFDATFHRAELTQTTRMDARERFRPREAPATAVTAGLADIRAAQRVVLVATGAKKAPAIDAMRHGPIGPACPATVLRDHPSAVAILDREAATLER